MRIVKILPYLMLILFWMGFFYREIFDSYIFSCCDNFIINAPIKAFIVEQWKAGKLPLWNPFIYAGNPLMADVNNSVFSPLSGIYFFLPIFSALTWNILLSFLFASIGMYLFSRSMGLNQVGAIASAVIFAYSGSMVWSSDDLPVTQVLSFLPWVMLAWNNYLSSGKKASLVILVLLQSMQIFSGHPHVVYMTLLVGIFYSAYCLRSWSRFLVFVIPFLVLTGLVTAVQIVPFLEFVWQSPRVSADFVFASSDAFHPTSAIRLLFPALSGNLAAGTAWWDGGVINGFVGFVAFLLGIVVGQYLKKGRFFFWTAVISLLISYGTSTPFFTMAYWLLPGFSLFRSPQNYLVIYTFCMAVLAGFGLDALSVKSKIFNLQKIVLVIIFLILLVLIGLHFFPQHFFLPQHIRSSVIVNLWLCGGGLFFLFIVFPKILKSNTWYWLIVIFMYLELCQYSRNMLITTPQHVVFDWMKKGEGIAQNISPFDWRFNRVQIMPSLFVRPDKDSLDLEKSSAWNGYTLWSNQNMFYKIPSTTGTTALSIGSFHDFIGEDRNSARIPHALSISNQASSLLGVKYLLGTRSDEARLSELAVEKIYDGDDLIIYHNKQALPRFYLDNQQAIQTSGVEVDLYAANEVKLTAVSSSSAQLVFVDTIYPGWKVYVNGQEKPLVSYQNTFKSVSLEPGESEVEFFFKPKSVYWGAVTSALGVLVCTLILILRRSVIFDNIQ